MKQEIFTYLRRGLLKKPVRRASNLNLTIRSPGWCPALGKTTLLPVSRSLTIKGMYSTLIADAYVVAMGSDSPLLVKPLGMYLPIYPVKGYSSTLQVTNPALTPMVSISDSAYKMVFTRIGNRLRIAGTAELNGYNRQLNPVRCAALTQRAKALFPGACDFEHRNIGLACDRLHPPISHLLDRPEFPTCI